MARIKLSTLDPQPAGFGKCGTCAYLTAGTSDICYACAAATFDAVADTRCTICDGPVTEDDPQCHNPVCSFDERYFGMTWAIAMKTGSLEKAIWRYKYDNKTSWSLIFGRVFLGYLDAHHRSFEDVGLIVASPGWGERRHTERIVARASVEASRGDEGSRWPFDVAEPRAIIKTAETPSFKGKSWRRRWEISEDELRDALHVPDPARVAGKRILVFDDVFTEGLTLRGVARALIEAGATSVDEVVLARQPFRKAS